MSIFTINVDSKATWLVARQFLSVETPLVRPSLIPIENLIILYHVGFVIAKCDRLQLRVNLLIVHACFSFTDLITV